MDAVWPDTAVEENNLTVQVSTLRRLLDQGRPDGSCIQTVPGRGYRFVDACRARRRLTGWSSQPGATVVRATICRMPKSRSMTCLRRPASLGVRRLVWPGVGMAFAWPHCYRVRRCRWRAVFAAHGRHGWVGRPTDPPRLSLVVLPFENLGGDTRDDYLADGITDDLTSDLSHIPGALVIARQSAYAYRGKPKDVRKIGAELGVRYVLEGSVRKIESVLRVNVQLRI